MHATTTTTTSTTASAAQWPSLAPFDPAGATPATMLERIRALEEHRAACLRAYSACLEDLQHFRALALDLQGIPAR